MKTSKKYFKSMRLQSAAVIASMASISIIMSGFGVVTEANLTDSAAVQASSTADIWVVPSVSPSADNFQGATVNWTQTGSYTSYTLQYSTSSTFATVTTLTVTGLTKSVTGLTDNTTYYFRVKPAASPTGTWKSSSVLIPKWSPAVVGIGWNGYTPVESGDLNKDGARDLDVIQTNTGVLYMYPGGNTGGVSSSSKVQIGTGFNSFLMVDTAGDWNEDGREDLLTVDTSGYLWLYTTKTAWTPSAPYNAPVKIGQGWQGLWGVGGVGDVTGDGHPDITGVDSNNILRVYPGNGAGGFSPVILTNTPFANYTFYASIGDLNKDGKNDLVAMDSTGQMWFLAGNGVSTTSTFKAAVKIPNMVLGAQSELLGPGDMDNDGYWDITEMDTSGNMNFWKGSDMAIALGF